MISPMYVGYLWNVTSSDLDDFMLGFIKKLFTKQGNQ